MKDKFIQLHEDTDFILYCKPENIMWMREHIKNHTTNIGIGRDNCVLAVTVKETVEEISKKCSTLLSVS